MKQVNLLLWTITAILLLSCSNKPRTMNSNFPMELAIPLQKRELMVKVKDAIPRSGPAISLTSSYGITIRNDSVFSQLLYGRAFSIPYGGGNGLNFSAPLEAYQASPGRRNNYNVEFMARTEEGRFRFYMDVSSNGRTTVTVNSDNREGISFNGKMIRPVGSN